MSNTGHKQRREERRRLWGRAKGRPLSPRQAKLVEILLPQITVQHKSGNALAGLETYKEVVLEIGFGGGEHLLHIAQQKPAHVFLGAEPFLNGVAKTLTGIEQQGLKNIRLHHGDVRAVLDALPDASLDMIYILYPDPWPKPRHYKRRLIQEDLIEDLYRTLKPGAELRFASDIISYVDWALARILRHGGFDWNAESCADWGSPYEDWPSTRYEAKAYREGRTPHYFRFLRV